MDCAIIKQPTTSAVPARALNDEAKVKIAVYEQFRKQPAGTKKTEWIKQVGKQFGISPSTVRRYVADVKDNSYSRERRGRGISAWDPEALQWFQGFYLKAIDEIGDCSKVAAYRALEHQARIMGWKIGSMASSYQHLQQLHPLLSAYARGGNRALDNYFYILRNLDALRPMQIVVGDQHIFNWWVCDYDTGRIFRMTGYLWLDMATRVIYGIAFDEKYNYRTVKRALKTGLLRFGKFECTYNDNGKPEISRAMNEVIAELQAWGMENQDLSELYRTDAGYAVEDPESGDVMDYAQTPEAWHKYNRRILAQVKNAKAKPIEKFFRTLEQLLVDQRLPGMCRNINASAPEDEKATARLKYQKEKGLLLTPEEFQEQVIGALEIYETRYHHGLKMTPREKLMERVTQGWEPTRIDDRDLNFIFMERTERKVTAGKIVIGNVLYEGEELQIKNGFIDNTVGITQFEGRSLQVRYDPEDPSDAYAVAPDGSIRPLLQSKKFEMLNDNDADEAISKKRRQMKVVRNAFKQLISSVEGSLVNAVQTHRLAEAETRKTIALEAKAVTDTRDLEAEIEKRIDASQTVIPFGVKRVHATPGERYKAILSAQIIGSAVSEQDRAFQVEFEENLNPDERLYWQEYRRMMTG